MICFKGQLGFKQYMKDKATKWGIKVFTLNDAINEYVYGFQVCRENKLVTLLILACVPEFV